MDMGMSPGVLEPEMIVCPPDVVQVPPPWLQDIIDMLAMFGFGGFL